MLIARFLFLFIIVALLGFNNVSHCQSSGKTKNAGNNKKKSDVGETKEVIAEGVGNSPDNAIKDAFRNAVRQVVGVLVDSETLVKNDKLVDDKILTLSNGFINDYSEIPGSQKAQGGIYRVKIKAFVVTGSVIDKLKAVNISVNNVNGKGLFAESVSKLESENNALSLIYKHMKNFPISCMKATVVGAPKIVENKADKVKARILIKIETDSNAYKLFAEGLTTVLEKIAIEKGNMILNYKPSMSDPIQGENLHKIRPSVAEDEGFDAKGVLMELYQFTSRNTLDSFHTRLAELKKGTVFLVGTRRNEFGTNCAYRYFRTDLVTDLSERPVSVLNIKLLDDKDEAIFEGQKRLASIFKTKPFNCNLVLVDTLFSLDFDRHNFCRSHSPFYFFEFDFELTPMELKNVKTIKTEIVHDPAGRTNFGSPKDLRPGGNFGGRLTHPRVRDSFDSFDSPLPQPPGPGGAVPSSPLPQPPGPGGPVPSSPLPQPPGPGGAVPSSPLPQLPGPGGPVPSSPTGPGAVRGTGDPGLRPPGLK